MTLSPFLLRAPLGGLALVVVACIVRVVVMDHPAWTDRPPGAVDGFMGENMRAMDRMAAGMNVTSSGNVDRDFVAMMVPHHQGAIDMAMAELRYGKDETLRRMAQGIIVGQQQEIVAMRLAAQGLPVRGATATADPDICTGRPAARGR